MNVTDSKKWIDHIDRNGLNNQKSNLRFCTPSQNRFNRKSQGKSKYLGVSCDNRIVKYKLANNRVGERLYQGYRALIRINGKQTHLGCFPFTPEGEIQAAKAYDEAAKKHHGEFARLNFPNG